MKVERCYLSDHEVRGGVSEQSMCALEGRRPTIESLFAASLTGKIECLNVGRHSAVC